MRGQSRESRDIIFPESPPLKALRWFLADKTVVCQSMKSAARRLIAIKRVAGQASVRDLE